MHNNAVESLTNLQTKRPSSKPQAKTPQTHITCQKLKHQQITNC